MTESLLCRARTAAVRAVEAAALIIENARASRDYSVQFKSDESPVTEVDVAAEEAIRAVLSEAVPEASFEGEETGHSSAAEAGADRWCWLVDPIDGTKSFIRDMPYFSTQIALEHDGELVLGVSNAPAFGERLEAVRGEGVWIDDQAVQVRSGIDELEDAFLSSGNLTSLARSPDAWARYGSLVARVRRCRGYGDFRHYHQLCCGQTDLIIESDLNILDIAALSVGVAMAGGVMTDLEGRAIGRATRSVLAAGSPALHRQALSLLSANETQADRDRAALSRLATSGDSS